MGFERNYQIKVLSKQLNKTNFCTSAYAQVQLTKLDPWFVTGFCDGEASFSVSIYIDKRIKGRVGWVVKPSFQISLHSRDMKLLLQRQENFTCGSIVSKNNRSEKSFRVNSIQDKNKFFFVCQTYTLSDIYLYLLKKLRIFNYFADTNY